jgi:hypothetical protein
VRTVMISPCFNITIDYTNNLQSTRINNHTKSRKIIQLLPKPILWIQTPQSIKWGGTSTSNGAT